MKRVSARRGVRALLFGAVLATGACLGSPSVSQRLLVFPATAPRELADGQPLEGRTLGLGPIEVAPGIDSDFVAIRVSETEYEYADSLRWARPVTDLVADRLGEMLLWATGASDIRAFPWPVSRIPAVQVTLRLTRFEGLPGREVALAGHWTVVDGATGAVAASGFWEHREPRDDLAGSGIPSALDRGLQALALTVRDAVAGLR